MADIELTNDAKALLSKIYEIYKTRRERGLSIDDAKRFQVGKLREIAGELGWCLDDTCTVLRELRDAGLVTIGAVYTFRLNLSGIRYMESKERQSRNKMKNWIGKIAKGIVSAINFLFPYIHP